MAIFWITEALPLAVTALLPIFLFPLLGVSKVNTLASTYTNVSQDSGWRGFHLKYAHYFRTKLKKKLAFINDLCAIVLNVFREVFVTDNLLKDLKN